MPDLNAKQSLRMLSAAESDVAEMKCGGCHAGPSGVICDDDES
jgi:hypothetical protein